MKWHIYAADKAVPLGTVDADHSAGALLEWFKAHRDSAKQYRHFYPRPVDCGNIHPHPGCMCSACNTARSEAQP